MQLAVHLAVSEAALSSAMDVLDDKWSVSDDGSNADGRHLEVLELLQPGETIDRSLSPAVCCLCMLYSNH